MAVLVSHPLDLSEFACQSFCLLSNSLIILVKVRMQMEPGGAKAGTFASCVRIVRGEGVLALYNGVSWNY
jgi:dicarboxylate transporter 10